jgi:hydroxypyruvate isomerase
MPRFAANLTMMFTERAFPERFAAAAAAGFEAVEFLFPYAEAPDAIRECLTAADLDLALFNTPAGDWDGGERGLAAVPGAEARFEQAFARALEYAQVLRPERLHVVAGIASGAEARRTYVANLRRAEAAAGDQVLTIEPVNARDIPGFHLANTADALRVIEAVGAENLKLQLDLYHLQISEGDLTRRIEALAPVIGHVQIAGVPDRHEPDLGETALRHLLDVLDSVGYRGWIGCEYHPAGLTEDGLGWFAPWRRKRKSKGANK